MSWLDDRVVARLAGVAALPELPDERYTLQDVLGDGGMATVYLARDHTLDRDVAIKVAHNRDPGFADRLRREARVLACLEHPGIVPVHDAGVLADGRVFYVMKRVHGETLTAWLARVPELERRLGLFERVCEAVAFAHQRGIVHRDLKPDNIMVGAFGEVLVLDWGVAKVLGESETPVALEPLLADGGHTRPGTVLGTPGFMPPEQARGDATDVDPRADVYALGVILHQLITTVSGVQPSHDASPENARRNRQTPKRLWAIRTRALQSDPKSRYGDAAALADDVGRYRALQPVHAYRETWLDRAQRFASFYRTPILIVIGYLIMRVLVEFVRR